MVPCLARGQDVGLRGLAVVYRKFISSGGGVRSSSKGAWRGNPKVKGTPPSYRRVDDALMAWIRHEIERGI